MATMEELRRERKRILGELARLEEMRRGSVVEQFVETTRKDGSKSRRGPYPLYSYKKKGKTISRRLLDRTQAARYRTQIQAFRRFQKLTSRLLAIGEQISELLVAEEGVKKTSLRKSISSKTPK
jgi:hypothetical protein